MILNKTTNELIDVKIACADTFLKRFRGLMCRDDFCEVMVFSNLKSSSLHTFFMKFEIDVYFLDKNKVIFEKTSLKPWKVYKPKKSAHYILETKKKFLNLRSGDILEFIR